MNNSASSVQLMSIKTKSGKVRHIKTPLNFTVGNIYYLYRNLRADEFATGGNINIIYSGTYGLMNLLLAVILILFIQEPTG